jgi:hypothetical protein
VPTDLERLLNLVRRELGAADARFLPPEEEARRDLHHVSCRLADGRGVEARFEEAPPDREAKQRRLEMLAGTFDTVVEEGGASSRRGRPAVGVSLHDELTAICTRTGAVNAIIIDANSPVVWAAAYPDGVVAQPPLASSPRVAEAPANDEGLSQSAPAVLSRRAVHDVRGWTELGALRKGKHMRKIERGDGAEHASLLAHSFASIYIVLVVFDGPFDELRAERAVVEALPRIERLVLALPPLDPDPIDKAGAIAIRRPRRR